MTDKPTIPEEFRADVEAAARIANGMGHTGIADRLLAALPAEAPAFSDEECLAFYETAWLSANVSLTPTEHGRTYLTRLAEAGWRAPAALSAPMVVDVDEVVRRLGESCDWTVGGICDVLHAMNEEKT